MSIFLLFTLVGVGSLYFMLEAELLGAIQFVVYAGGTLILIVFGVMLTSNSPMANLKVSRFELILGSILAVVIGASLLMSLALTKLPESISVLAPVSSEDQVALVGRALLGGYVLPFEVAGVLLLVVMVGAAFMARKRADKHRAVAATATAPQTESASVSSH